VSVVADMAPPARCLALVQILSALVRVSAEDPGSADLEGIDDVAAQLLDEVERLLEREAGSKVEPAEGVSGRLVLAIYHIGVETDAITLANVERGETPSGEVPTARPTFLPLERAVRVVDELLRQVLIARGLLPALSEGSS